MKYSSAFVLAALLGATQVEQSQAIKLNTEFTDDLVKSLAEDMQKDAEAADTSFETAPEKKEEKKEKPK